jgi:hypothetical protein
MRPRKSCECGPVREGHIRAQSQISPDWWASVFTDRGLAQVEALRSVELTCLETAELCSAPARDQARACAAPRLVM